MVWKTCGGAKGRYLFRGEEAQRRTGDGPLGYQRHESSGVAIPRRPCGLWPQCKELGKPDAGKPPVRFDEGRGAVGPWTYGLSIQRVSATLHPYLRFPLINSPSTFGYKAT